MRSRLGIIRRLMRIREVAEMLDVSTSVLRRWEASGRLVADRVGTHRQCDLAKLRPEQFRISQSATHRTVAHARVSSLDQEADLERQKQVLEPCRAKQGWICEVVADPVDRGEDTAFEDDLAKDVLGIIAVFRVRLVGWSTADMGIAGRISPWRWRRPPSADATREAAPLGSTRSKPIH